MADTQGYEPTPTSFVRSPLFPIFLVVLVDVFGFTLVLPLLGFYAEHLGASPLEVGFISAAFAICQFVSGPILGRLSDRIGRRPVLLLSQVGTFIGFIILGFSSTLWLLFLSRIIDGATAGNLSIAQAYIADVTRPEERTKAFGLIGIAFGAGFTIGPAISGFLARFGYEYPAFAAALLSLTSILCTYFLLPEVRAKAAAASIGRLAQVAAYFRRPLTRGRLLEYFCFLMAFAIVISGFPLFLERLLGFGAEETGYMMAASGVIGGLIQGGLLGRLVKRTGEERLATIGFIAMVIGYGLMGWVFGWPALLILIVFSAFGSSVARPALTTLLTRSVHRNESGTVLGVGQSLQSIAMIIGPLLGGWLIQHRYLKAFGLAAGGMAFLGALFGLRRRGGGMETEEEPAATGGDLGS